MSGREEIQDEIGNEIVGQDPNESSGTDELQVEVIDDTPPEDKNRPRRTGEPDLGDEDEVAQYSDKVKKRISKLRLTRKELAQHGVARLVSRLCVLVE